MTTLEKRSADAVRAIFADVVRKVCFGARAPELIQALDIDVGNEPHRDISERPEEFITVRLSSISINMNQKSPNLVNYKLIPSQVQ